MTQPKQGDERIARKTAQRSELILQELLRAGSLSVEDLAQRLGVDASTIRRDLVRLEQRQLLKRVHGGAIQLDPLAYNTNGDDLSFQRSMQQHVEEQTRIALAATRLIEPGDLDRALAGGHHHLPWRGPSATCRSRGLTVVTNALNIAMELAGLRNVTLTLVGGILLSDFFATVGPMAEHNLHELYTSKALHRRART